MDTDSAHGEFELLTFVSPRLGKKIARRTYNKHLRDIRAEDESEQAAQPPGPVENNGRAPARPLYSTGPAPKRLAREKSALPASWHSKETATEPRDSRPDDVGVFEQEGADAPYVSDGDLSEPKSSHVGSDESMARDSPSLVEPDPASSDVTVGDEVSEVEAEALSPSSSSSPSSASHSVSDTSDHGSGTLPVTEIPAGHFWTSGAPPKMYATVVQGGSSQHATLSLKVEQLATLLMSQLQEAHHLPNRAIVDLNVILKHAAATAMAARHTVESESGSDTAFGEGEHEQGSAEDLEQPCDTDMPGATSASTLTRSLKQILDQCQCPEFQQVVQCPSLECGAVYTWESLKDIQYHIFCTQDGLVVPLENLKCIFVRFPAGANTACDEPLITASISYPHGRQRKAVTALQPIKEARITSYMDWVKNWAGAQNLDPFLDRVTKWERRENVVAGKLQDVYDGTRWQAIWAPGNADPQVLAMRRDIEAGEPSVILFLQVSFDYISPFFKCPRSTTATKKIKIGAVSIIILNLDSVSGDRTTDGNIATVALMENEPAETINGHTRFLADELNVRNIL